VNSRIDTGHLLAAARARLRIQGRDCWYIGTPAQLIAAGLLDEHMLARKLGKAGSRRIYDEFGDLVIIERRGASLLLVKRLNSGRDLRGQQAIDKAVGRQVSELLDGLRRQSQRRS